MRTQSCAEKESVLKREQNQIINLTTRIPEYRDLAGCSVVNPGHTTRRPRYTLTIPTLPPRKPTTKPTKAYTTPARGSETIETTTMLYELSTATTPSESVTDSSTAVSSLLEDFTDVYDAEFDSENIFDNLLANATEVSREREECKFVRWYGFSTRKVRLLRPRRMSEKVGR